jgi:L1 cell adhesion molecule like protein
MIDEAEKNKEEDAKFRKKIDARNELEAYALQMQGVINDLAKLTVNDKKVMIQTVSHTLSWLEENTSAELEQIQSKKRDLEGLCAPIITKLYNS